jgi:rhodanese-related sulfurtransferase
MNTTSSNIKPAEAYDLIHKQNAFLLDVRTPEEFGIVRASDVVANIPESDIAARTYELPKNRPILTICANGPRGESAAETLLSLGFSNVHNVDGGTNAWRAAGLPTIVLRKVLPIDQQFRLVLGVMVLLFTTLGALRSRRWLFGNAFIGTALTITSLLGICPMLSFIRMMPWNRIKTSTPPIAPATEINK